MDMSKLGFGPASGVTSRTVTLTSRANNNRRVIGKQRIYLFFFFLFPPHFGHSRELNKIDQTAISSMLVFPNNQGGSGRNQFNLWSDI